MAAARARGATAVLGDGARLDVLRRTGLERARLLIIATPEPYVGRAIIERARKLNPTIEIIARAHSQEERHYLDGAGAELALVPERELAFALGHHALRHLGCDDDQADRVIDALRAE